LLNVSRETFSPAKKPSCPARFFDVSRETFFAGSLSGFARFNNKNTLQGVFYRSSSVRMPDNRDFLQHQGQKIHKSDRLLVLH
jgi:hypothetical protein